MYGSEIIREHGEALVVKYGKILIFLGLVTVGVVLAVNNRENYLAILQLEAVLIAENAVKIWGLKSYKTKIVCYVLDTLILLLLTYFSDGTLISTLYMIILTEFYLSQEKLSGSIAMCACSIGLFLLTLGVSRAMQGETVAIGAMVAGAFNDLVLLSLHFLIVNFALQLYRKNQKITKTLEELNASNEKLRLAYNELQEVTALEERQRIAKDIHDTAGHSITTVIMQTEAAKLVIDSDPAAAKQKIAAANLQAKHALEELRESVHLLSGIGENATLRDMLLSIIHDSTDGTDLVIRSDIEDLTLSDAKSRFICNTLKEGISNGLRHGGATAFYFELRKEGNRVFFLLSDNGEGTDVNSLKEGFGLTGMHARAESLGGNVYFETEPGEGFEIHLVLPADAAKQGGNS